MKDSISLMTANMCSSIQRVCTQEGLITRSLKYKNNTDPHSIVYNFPGRCAILVALLGICRVTSLHIDRVVFHRMPACANYSTSDRIFITLEDAKRMFLTFGVFAMVFVLGSLSATMDLQKYVDTSKPIVFDQCRLLHFEYLYLGILSFNQERRTTSFQRERRKQQILECYGRTKTHSCLNTEGSRVQPGPFSSNCLQWSGILLGSPWNESRDQRIFRGHHWRPHSMRTSLKPQKPLLTADC